MADPAIPAVSVARVFGWVLVHFPVAVVYLTTISPQSYQFLFSILPSSIRILFSILR